MGYMKDIDIQTQNIFEGKIHLSIEFLELQIDDLFKRLAHETDITNQYVLIESINRCYNVYSLMQIEFWEKNYTKELK